MAVLVRGEVDVDSVVSGYGRERLCLDARYALVAVFAAVVARDPARSR